MKTELVAAIVATGALLGGAALFSGASGAPDASPGISPDRKASAALVVPGGAKVAKTGPLYPSELTTPFMVVSTAPWAMRSEVRIHQLGALLTDPVASFEHSADPGIRAEVVPASYGFHHYDGNGWALAVTAPIADPRRDLSFGSALMLVTKGSSDTLLTGVTYLDQPRFANRRVWVTRGKAGAPPVDGSLRVDELELVAVGADSSEAAGTATEGHATESADVTTRYQLRGYVLHLIGFYDDAPLVYQVDAEGASIARIDNGVAHIITTVLPFARDFSLHPERGLLVYRNRHSDDARRWVVDRLDLSTGQIATIRDDVPFAATPQYWPDGRLLLSLEGHGGLYDETSLTGVLDSANPSAALSAGSDLIVATSPDANFVLGRRTVAGKFEQPWAAHVASGRLAPISLPEGQHHVIAGFVPVDGGAP